MSENCKSCDAGHTLPCGCGFCGGQMVCARCFQVHAELSIFFDDLLTAKSTERSDSRRARMFAMFYEVAGKNLGRDGTEGRNRQFFFDTLRYVNPFCDSPAAFGIAVRKAIAAFPFTRRAVEDLVEYSTMKILERLIDDTVTVLGHDHVRDLQEMVRKRENKDRRRRLDAATAKA